MNRNSNNSESVRAVITGGTQGVGLAVARQLASEGAQAMVIAGRDVEKGNQAADEISQLGASCKFVRADVGVPEDCLALMDAAHLELGTVNSLVNAAGTAARSGLLDTDLTMWSAHFDINARGPFLLMQHLVAELLKSNRHGSIVNIVSKAAYCGAPEVTPYSASKGALATLTKNVANAFSSHNIRCNGIMAGWMETPGDDEIQRKFHGRTDDWQDDVSKSLPMGQLAQPRNLAPLVTYLLGPASGVMTGALIDYDQHVSGS